MNRWMATAWLLATVVIVPADAEEPGGPGVLQDRIGSVERVHVAVPGLLVDVAFQDGGDGFKTVWFLVEPFGPEGSDEEQLSDDEQERRKQLLPPCPAGDRSRGAGRLFRLDREGAGKLVEVRSDIPWNSSAIRFAAFREDQAPSLLLTVVQGDEDPEAGDRMPGLYTWDGDPASPRSRLVPLLDEPFLVHTRTDPGLVIGPGMGELTLYRFGDESGRFEPEAVVPMPLDAAVRQDRITLTARTVLPVHLDDGRSVFATYPEPFGKTRLRTTVIHPDVDGEDRVVESWSRLPGPEDIMDSDHRVLNGSPVLVVQTKTAEKLALFGEKRVRIYPLDKDRSRSGFPPIMAADTGMNLWQDGTPWIVDVNGDGTSDLVLGYWKGLKNSRVVLEAYLGQDDGTFARKPRTTALDVEDGERSFVGYGRDLNGDDLLDLLVAADGRLHLFPGIRSRNGKKLVDPEPELILDTHREKERQEGSVTIAIGTEGASAVQSAALSIPSYLDLDGDGVVELLQVTRGTSTTPGTFTVLFLNSDR